MARKILDFPTEIILFIFKSLSLPGQAAFARVSQKTKELVTNELYKLDDTRIVPKKVAREAGGDPISELQYALSKAGNEDGEQLMLRILKGSIKAVQCNPDRQMEALLHSSTFGFERALRALLDAGISPDPSLSLVVEHKMTPLFASIENGHIGVIKMLLNAGATLRRYDFDCTAEMIRLAPKAIVEELMQGLDLELLAENHDNLLHRACTDSKWTREDIKVLLDHGLDLYHVNTARQTPVSYCFYDATNSMREEAEILELLLHHGNQIANSPCDDNYYPLHLACEEGSKEIVELLLSKGADPNRQHPATGETALYALSRRNEETPVILAALVEAGLLLSTDLRSFEAFLLRSLEQGWTSYIELIYHSYLPQLEPLNCYDLLFKGAAAAGDTEIMQALISTHLVYVDSDGYALTALEVACTAGKEHAVRFLINEAKFSNVNHRGSHGMTAIHAAIKCGASGEGIIRFLLPLIHFDNAPEAHRNATPLSDAILCQEVAIVSLLVDRLIECKPSKEILGESLTDALLNAVSADDRGTAEALIYYMKKMGLLADYGYPLAFEAIDLEYKEMAFMLIDNALTLDTRFLSHTPLMCAIDHGFMDIAAKLIERGVDVEAKTLEGETALMRVCADNDADDDAEMNNAYIVRELLRNHADVDAVNDVDETAIDYAVASGNTSAVHQLLAAGARTHSKLLRRAAKREYKGILKALLMKGLDVNAPSANKRNTPLLCAASCGGDRMVRALIKYGANVNQPNKAGQTPLSVAAIQGELIVVEMLLEAGAMVDVADNNGETPLFWAVQNGHAEIAWLLIRHEANINHRSDTGSGAGQKTLLHIAVDKQDASIARILISAGCNPFATDSLGRTPLQLAHGDDVLAVLYSSHPARGNTSMGLIL